VRRTGTGPHPRAGSSRSRPSGSPWSRTSSRTHGPAVGRDIAEHVRIDSSVVPRTRSRGACGRSSGRRPRRPGSPPRRSRRWTVGGHRVVVLGEPDDRGVQLDGDAVLGQLVAQDLLGPGLAEHPRVGVRECPGSARGLGHPPLAEQVPSR
jgi:hypothetical protein